MGPGKIDPARLTPGAARGPTARSAIPPHRGSFYSVYNM